MVSLETLLQNNAHSILFECVAGSRAYGTVTSSSDEDIRGVFAVPSAVYLSLARPADQVSDERGNTVYYSVRRIIELLAQANPNILELLFMPADCVLRSSPEMELLVSRRHIFISKQCADTYAGYAMSQIKKARGQNKWINNPKPEEPPKKESYCHVIPWKALRENGPPSRPMSLAAIGWDLSEFHAAKLEHARDTYRLYRYGKSARGVFRGELLVCESIPKEDEATRFAGLLLFNEQGWKQALVDHQNYWGWRKERNEERWKQQERGELDFDSKNMMHTVRLLLSGRSIMANGHPIVRFEGEALALLMSIREGKMSFDEIMELAQSILADCQKLKERSDLPDACELSQADAVLREVTEAWESRRA